MASVEELEEIRPRLLGMVAEARITVVSIPRTDGSIRERFLALTDMTSIVSDALDALGVIGAIPASELKPIRAGQRVCGPAITIRYMPVDSTATALYAQSARPLLADRELYQIGEPGDVALFDCGGQDRVSVLGGLSGAWASKRGIAGCIVDGGVRDIMSNRELGIPLWSRGRTPITGRHRMEAVELNGPVSIAGVRVQPGDLVVADDTGICVVPFGHVNGVIEACEEREAAELRAMALLAEGVDVAALIEALPIEHW